MAIEVYARKPAILEMVSIYHGFPNVSEVWWAWNPDLPQ